MKPLTQVLIKVAESIKPPPDLLVSDWADKYRVLSPESSAMPGKWRTDFTPYVKEIMDCENDPLIHTTVWQASAQVGKTEVLNNLIGYSIHQDPCPILAIQPTVDMATAYSHDRLRPMIRDSAVLAEIINMKKRSGGNTVLHKTFAGGNLSMVGANSPSGLASRPKRKVYGDEIDRYENSAGTEGDPLLLAEKRTTTFYNKYHFYCSTPGNAETSRIEPLFLSGDQRYYHVPCPHCGVFQVLRWPMIKFDAHDTEGTTHYECEECEGKIWDKDKRFLIDNGVWKAKEKFNGTASFHIWEAYSPWVKFHEIVDRFLSAKKNPEELKVWVNTSLGETWSAKGDAPDWKRLYERRETWDRKIVPKEGLVLTAAIDVQRNRLEMEVKAWGRHQESWSIDYFVFEGDTADITSAKSPYREIEKLMNHKWQSEHGRDMQIQVTAIDSSDQTMSVYTWARMHGSRVMCIKGRHQAQALLGAPTPQDIRKNGRKTRKGVMLYIVGTDIGKTALYGRLKMEKPTDEELKKDGYPLGFMHFNDWQDDEYFKQLCAEQKERKRNRQGYFVNEWKKIRERNEALDISLYNMACYDRLGLSRYTDDDWHDIEVELGMAVPVDKSARPSDEEVMPVVKNSNGVKIKRKRSSYMNRGHDGR